MLAGTVLLFYPVSNKDEGLSSAGVAQGKTLNELQVSAQ